MHFFLCQKEKSAKKEATLTLASEYKRTSRYTFRSTKGISPLNGSLGYSDREMAFLVRSQKQILSPRSAVK